MTLEWCPSNIVGTFGSTTANFTQQSLGPFIFTDDPDTYSQNGDSLAARLQKPSFITKPVLSPWKITRSNAKLYGAGVLAQGDTAKTNPMFDQISNHPLAGASLGLQLPGSGSTQIGTRFFAGMLTLTYMVRFVSIKPSNVSNVATPAESSRIQTRLAAEASLCGGQLSAAELDAPTSASTARGVGESPQEKANSECGHRQFTDAAIEDYIRRK
jgi:hypothetical protein